jgi:hypothetical protein
MKLTTLTQDERLRTRLARVLDLSEQRGERRLQSSIFWFASPWQKPSLPWECSPALVLPISLRRGR